MNEHQQNYTEDTEYQDFKTEFEAKIGLEIHVQLKTNTKLFCSCPRDPKAPPNTNICPICVGLPGVLPVLNKQAIVLAVRAALLLNMKINRKSFFERKNYFYPDLPKNYQISQYKVPLAEGGFLEIDGGRKIRIQRLHIEEDAGKMIHGDGISYVDFSRSGTPLVEIVSMPDISTPSEAYDFLTKLHRVLVWCNVTEGSMEEGNLRCDVNVSVRPKGERQLGTKVEIKNINSFRFIRDAIDYEIKRQMSVLRSGGVIRQETRGYDPTARKTFIMRTKEFAHDYRYFPDPDLLPLVITDDIISLAKEGIDELPDDAKKRFTLQYGLSDYAVDVLTSDKRIKNFFEELACDFDDKKLLANFLLEEVLRVVNEGICDLERDREKLIRFTSEVLKAQKSGLITRNAAKDAFREALSEDIDIKEAIEKRSTLRDTSEIQKVIDEVLSENPNEVERFKNGEKKLLQFFIGQVMKKLKGKSDPHLVKTLLEEKLK